MTFDNSDIFQVAFKRRWHILVIVVLAAVLGYVFSGEYFIKPRFKSTAVVYPVNIIPYSLESPTEQLLQLYHSADVRAMMTKRFNLAKRYEVESNGKDSSMTRLNNAYDENVMVRKTEFESIKIDICDVNADTACAMVNAIIDCVNQKARDMQRGKTKEVVKIFRDQLKSKEAQIDSLEKINSELRIRYGLLDFKSQTKEATKNYFKLLTEGASREKIRPVDSLMRNLEEKGGDLVSVSTQLDGLRDSYNDIKVQYDNAVSDLTKELTYSNVVTRPFPSDTKCYPVRSLIVLVSALSALLLALLLFVVFERREPSSSHAKPADQ